jgi:hypothetical protein
LDIDWHKLTARRAFISDLGGERMTNVNGEETVIGRYAAWLPVPQTDRHQVVEVSANLESLKKKYGVADGFVFELGKTAEG